ncbi:MAG TPA: hypothetical protein VMF29_07490 [Candidatus Edwardsbacteria bacterium]|nr:hypothetical protein [Candidatus Edwardsbacteria bacterium]
MAEISITIAELERLAGDASRYFAKLDETWGRASACKAALKAVEDYCKEQRIPRSTLAAFTDQQAQGAVYVELPQGSREFHGQAAELLLDCCSQEIADGDEGGWNKWREFADNIYYGIIDELYANFASARPELALVFELAYRQLMAEMALTWWDGQPAAVAAHRPAIDRRLGLELSGMLRLARQQVLADKPYDQGLIERVLDRGWDLDIDIARCPIGQMAFLLREQHLSPWMFSELFHLLYSAQVKNQEEVVYDSLRTAAFSKPDEIVALLTGKLPKASDLALREIQKILVKRAQELEARLAQELADLQKFSLRVKKQTSDLIAQNNGEVSKVVETRLFSENLVNLSSKIGDALIQFQRGLFSQLWYLQDLERKERNLQGFIEKCQALQKIAPKDLLSILTDKTDDASASVVEHLEQYRIFEQEIGKDWERWTGANAKLLLELLRQAADQAQGRAAQLERDLAKRGPKDPQTAPLRQELQQLALDQRALAGLVEERSEGRAYHVEKIVAGYRAFLKDAAEALMTYKRLSSLVRLWPPLLLREPPLLRQQELFDEIRYVSDRLKRSGRCFIMAAQGPVTPAAAAPGDHDAEVKAKLTRRHFKAVSVMAYDIRGSSFMSAKLHNAEKEREIKNKLGYLISQVVRSHGGFLIKDTGDGGLAWFGENGPELTEKCFKEVVTGRGVKLRHSLTSGAELTMIPSADAGKQALTCAVELLKLAEKFIQDNFTNYRDWFKQATEREIFHDGTNYAVLPPAFKALFRIGVGIASGEVGRDVALALNAYGDIDLSGVLVNNASLYSTCRDPMRSKVLADHATAFNLLLNSDRFESDYLHQLFLAKASGVEEWEKKLWDAMGTAKTVLPDGTYLFPQLGLQISRTGFQGAAQNDASKLETLQFQPHADSVVLADDGAVLEPDARGELKLLYEVQPLAEGGA